MPINATGGQGFRINGDAFFIDLQDRLNEGGHPFPLPVAGPLESGFERVENHPVPKLFERGPTPLNRIVLAVIRRIVDLLDSEPTLA